MLGSRRGPVWHADDRAALELIAAADSQVQRGRKRTPERDAQGKVEPPAARVTRDIWAQTVILPAPALTGVNVAQGAPDAAPNAALWPACLHLELDLEKVERVHAEHCDCARTDSGERVVLKNKNAVSATTSTCFMTRTIACVGKREEAWLGVRIWGGHVQLRRLSF